MKIFTELENTFPYIEKTLDPKIISDLINCSYEDLFIFHFGLGTWIRNTVLNDNSYLYQAFKSGGITQKDDISTIIIQLFFLYLHIKYH